MKEICLCCNEQEIKFFKRKLCLACYTWLRNNGHLEEYPNIRSSFTIEKYGLEFTSDLKMLVESHHNTLQNMGDKYGLSRERIRQIFELFYGFKYSVAVKNISERLRRAKQEKVLTQRDPRDKVLRYTQGSRPYNGALSEKKVFDICAALNYEIKPFDGTAIDLVINGFKVEVKSTSKQCKTSPTLKTSQWRFHLRDIQKKADFIVCHCVTVNKFFVIPADKFPNSGNLFIPVEKHSQWQVGKTHKGTIKHTSKYYDYLEAWHLLLPNQKEVVFNIPQSAVVQ